MLSRPVSNAIERNFSKGKKILDAIETLQNLLKIQANDTPIMARVVFTIEDQSREETKLSIVLENGIELTETMKMVQCAINALTGVGQFLNRRSAEAPLSPKTGP